MEYVFNCNRETGVSVSPKVTSTYSSNRIVTLPYSQAEVLGKVMQILQTTDVSAGLRKLADDIDFQGMDQGID